MLEFSLLHHEELLLNRVVESMESFLVSLDLFNLDFELSFP